MDFDLTIPPEAEFQSSVGLRQAIGLTAVYDHPTGVYATVSLAPEGGPLREVARRRIAGRASGPEGWQPLVADLSGWAGQRVTLRIEVRSDEPIVAPRLAWFGSPRLARSPSARGSSRPIGRVRSRRHDVDRGAGPEDRLDDR